MSKTSSATLLDIDSSIIERNLLLNETKERDEEFEKLFPNLTQPEIPSKLVRPVPGFCVKLRKTDGTKVFVNICHTDAIPAPPDITEQRLTEILSSDDPSDFRVPMSIGNPRQEPDKSGVPSDVYDVAINEVFFKKLEKSVTFRCFLLRIAFEGVQNKFEIELLADEFIVLKNRKAMGTLQQHRIQRRDSEPSPRPARPLIEEVGGVAAATARRHDVRESPAVVVPSGPSRAGVAGDAEMNRVVTASRSPAYRLMAEPPTGPPTHLVAELRLPDVLSAREITLDVGEDRIIVEARRKAYLLDVFVAYRLDQQASCAQFNRDSGLLTVTMPIVGG